MNPRTTKKIELGLEIPTAHLNDLVGTIDWYFCIATECLKDPAYFQWHTTRANHTHVMLDNGMYEEGSPMAIDTLLDIVEAMEPEIVFAPDQVGDRKLTIELTEEFEHKFYERRLDANTHIGVIPQGQDANDIVDCFEYFLSHGFVSPSSPVGISFLNDRHAVIRELQNRYHFNNPHIWWHFLGLYNLDEISSWPSTIRSMDTVKPIKGAAYGHDLASTPRGLGKWSTKMVVEDEALMFRNIATLHQTLTRRI